MSVGRFTVLADEAARDLAKLKFVGVIVSEDPANKVSGSILRRHKPIIVGG